MQVAHLNGLSQALVERRTPRATPHVAPVPDDRPSCLLDELLFVPFPPQSCRATNLLARSLASWCESCHLCRSSFLAFSLISLIPTYLPKPITNSPSVSASSSERNSEDFSIEHGTIRTSSQTTRHSFRLTRTHNPFILKKKS